MRHVQHRSRLNRCHDTPDSDAKSQKIDILSWVCRLETIPAYNLDLETWNFALLESHLTVTPFILANSACRIVMHHG